MFDLFGAEMPLAVRFFLAFLIVLGLIGATAWAVRKFGGGRLGGGGMRGRQPRLAVIDHTSVDTRRRLVLVRRDNIEHLLMIGGPTDLVVESHIVRGTPASREVAPRAPALPETLPRAIPLPEAEANGSWPLQPEPSGPAAPTISPPPPRRAPRVEPIAEGPPSFSPAPHPETPPRQKRDALAALADDLSASAPVPPRSRAAAATRPHPPEARPEPRAEIRAEPRLPTPPTEAEPRSGADQSLAEMAQRLEAALRKPKTGTDARDAAIREEPTPEHPAQKEGATAATPSPVSPPSPAPAAPSARGARPGEAKPAHTEDKAKEGKALYETLEQEMASLLGRPTGKT
jgi:flagellar protein FliO/FliZ